MSEDEQSRSTAAQVDDNALPHRPNSSPPDSDTSSPTSSSMPTGSALSGIADGMTSSISAPWDSSSQTLTSSVMFPLDNHPPSLAAGLGYDLGNGHANGHAYLTPATSDAGGSQFDYEPPSPTLEKVPTPEQGYNIVKLHERDDSDLWKGWRRKIFFLIPFVTVLNAVLYLGYIALRMACICLAQAEENKVYVQAWVFIAVEIFVAIPPLLNNMWTIWALKKRGRAKLRLMGNNVPTVDVFITSCGEGDEVVMDTVLAACHLDYPADRFRVILLDDGKSDSLEKAMSELRKTFANTFYVARPKYPGIPHHFKSGNLNFGLDYVLMLPGGPGFYMAALDADMIPEPSWLRAVVPHLIQDPKMALACPPQLFYNTPPGDPLAQSLDFFVHVIEPIKDALGVAWCTGSGYVTRRDALEEIGNFPLGSLAEDVATSTLLLGKGWKTAYVHEPLQFGTVPEDFGGHLKQRTRWAIGTVDTSFKMKFCLYGEAVRCMSIAQRFSGFLYASLNLYTILLSVSIYAIPVILATGKPLVAYATQEQLRWLIRLCFASLVVNRIGEFILFVPAGYRIGRRCARYEMWMSPYLSMCIIRAFILPRWLGGETQAFRPTGSLHSDLMERDPKNRKGLFVRLRAFFLSYFTIYHLIFVYFTLTTLCLASVRCLSLREGPKETVMSLITHALWPPLTFVFICSSLWIPIAYAIDPPTVSHREQRLVRDPKTGVAHPTERAKEIAFGGEDAWYEIEYTITTLFTGFVFIFSFFI